MAHFLSSARLLFRIADTACHAGRKRGSGAGYDEATRLLVELREVAARFGETRQFQQRFVGWVQPHLRRLAFVKRLQAQRFALPEA
jgi:hypothetical protein